MVQATSEEEVNLFLVKMADKNVLPVRLWVYASLTTGVFIQVRQRDLQPSRVSSWTGLHLGTKVMLLLL